MTTHFRRPAALLLGIVLLGSQCQRLAPAYEPGRVLSFRREVIMDTITAVLDGQVLSLCQGKALPATMQLAGGGHFFRTVADAQGRFRFLHIPAAAYQLSATCPNYGALVADTIRLGAGDGSVAKIGLGCQVAGH